VILTRCQFLGRPDVDTIAIHEGRIDGLFSAAALPDHLQDEIRMDMGGRPVLPGFVDAHVHIFHTGLAECGWRISLDGLTRDETLAALSEAVRARGGGEWVIASGWDEGTWARKDYLMREELDRVSDQSPMAAVRMDGHLVVVNTPALKAASEVLRQSRFGELVDERRGEVREDAVWELLEWLEPDHETLSEALAAAAHHAHRLGITSVHTMTPPNRVPVLLAAGGRHRLRINVYHRISGPEGMERIDAAGAYDGEWVRFGGVKAFADGSLGAGNAAVNEPYIFGGRGALNHPDLVMDAILDRAERANWQTAIHAIGDRAIEQVLACHERVGTSKRLRHRVEHAELATRDTIERAGSLGIALSMQPNFIGNWSGPGSMNERRLGRVRDETSNPLAWVAEAGTRLALGSDGMPMSALYGVHSAVNGPYPAQRLSVDDALRFYTEGGAWLSFEEDIKGSLAPGAFADLIVLDDDPRSDPAGIADRRVEQVFVGGESVYRHPEEG